MFNDHCAKLSMVSPTGLGIRNDTKGSGYFRAKRGKRFHKGTDYLCKPGQNVYSPVAGKLVRIAYPYKDKSYQGCLIENPWVSLKIFYFKPHIDLIGKDIEKGQSIGFAQNISKKYGQEMRPHIHVEVTDIDVNLFVRM